MGLYKGSFVCLLLSLPAVLAFRCPPVGPVFPIPTGLDPDHPAMEQLAKTLDANIATLVDNLTQKQYDKITSFSLAITSLERKVYEYHHTASQLGKGSTKKVTGNTVYRIASISKTVTTLATLLQGECMDDPVTKYVPELKESPNMGGVHWDQVTLKTSTSHTAGLNRDYATWDLAQEDERFDGESLGLPPIDPESYAPCGKNGTDKICTRQQFFAGIKKKPALYRPNDRASYSDIGYEILGYALESMTGKAYEEVIQDQIFKPLGMTRSGTLVPKDGRGVVPNATNDWYSRFGHADPTGGIYSSTNDLSKYMRGIMNYKILPGHITRAWYKPVAFTAALSTTYGMSWEIYRTDRESNVTSDGRVIDVITKNGALEGYYSRIVMIPELGIGISVLTSGTLLALEPLVETAIRHSIPAFDRVAREKASKVYAGTYRVPEGTEPTTSLTLTVDDGPGLRVVNFTSRGVDILAEFEGRVFPTDIIDKNGDTYWRLSMEALPIETQSSNEQDDESQLTKRGIQSALSSRKGALYNYGLCFPDIDGLSWAGKPLTELVF